MNTNGSRLALIVAIEGIDGAGKQTQSELLKSEAQRLGFRAEILSFPRYNQTLFAQSIAAYLNGEFGPLEAVDPRLPALLYAGDRFETLPRLLELCQTQDIIILDRYVASNCAYQAAKVDTTRRASFISWIARVEHEVFGLPQADVTVYLDMPVQRAVDLVRLKRPRTYTTERADIHERNTHYLAACRDVYEALLTSSFRSRWVSIPCVLPGGDLQDPALIHDSIMQALRHDLAPRSARRSSSAATADDWPQDQRSVSAPVPQGDE